MISSAGIFWISASSERIWSRMKSSILCPVNTPLATDHPRLSTGLGLVGELRAFGGDTEPVGLEPLGSFLLHRLAPALPVLYGEGRLPRMAPPGYRRHQVSEWVSEYEENLRLLENRLR